MKPVFSSSVRSALKLSCVAAALGVSLAIAVPVSHTQVLSQPSVPTNPLEQLSESSLFFDRSNTDVDAIVEAGDVYLDGRRLFTVTAPVDSNSSGGLSGRSPIGVRVSTIEDNLRQLVKDGIDPETISVSTSFDEESGLPTVVVNDRYLMTITDADRQFRGATYTQLTETIEQGLIEAHRERQPIVLLRKGLLALSIAVGTIGVSFGLRKLRVKLAQASRRAVSVQGTHAEPDPAAPGSGNQDVEHQDLENRDSKGTATADTVTVGAGADINTDGSDEHDDDARPKELSPQASKQKLKYDFLGKAIQITRVTVWVGGAIGVANLFPYTRWIGGVISNALSGVVLELLVILGVTYLILRVSESAIEHLFAAIAEGRFITVDASPRLTQRIKTFSGVIKGAALVFITGVGTLVGLATIGIDIAPILAGAGILGLAVSFGAQSLVKDIINGFFILLEDQYGVGDVVSIDGSSGFVERMNLRITQLRSGDGNLITVPNGSITVVENLTSHWSRVNLGIEVAYSTDLDKAIEVIGREARRMQRERYWRDLIVDEPQVLGVDGFGDNSIVIRLWIKTLPLKHFEVGREYRKRLKKAFDREGISIPFPQRSLWFENELTSGDSAASSHNALSNGN